MDRGDHGIAEQNKQYRDCKARVKALPRGIVGDDPVEFAEDFLANDAEGCWLRAERWRLVDAIARAGKEA